MSDEQRSMEEAADAMVVDARQSFFAAVAGLNAVQADVHELQKCFFTFMLLLGASRDSEMFAPSRTVPPQFISLMSCMLGMPINVYNPVAQKSEGDRLHVYYYYGYKRGSECVPALRYKQNKEPTEVSLKTTEDTYKFTQELTRCINVVKEESGCFGRVAFRGEIDVKKIEALGRSSAPGMGWFRNATPCTKARAIVDFLFQKRQLWTARLGPRNSALKFDAFMADNVASFLAFRLQHRSTADANKDHILSQPKAQERALREAFHTDGDGDRVFREHTWQQRSLLRLAKNLGAGGYFYCVRRGTLGQGGSESCVDAADLANEVTQDHVVAKMQRYDSLDACAAKCSEEDRGYAKVLNENPTFMSRVIHPATRPVGRTLQRLLHWRHPQQVKILGKPDTAQTEKRVVNGMLTHANSIEEQEKREQEA